MFPRAHTLGRPMAEFSKLERLALNDVAVLPHLCNAYPLDMCVCRDERETLTSANGNTCTKFMTLDVRELTRTSFPALEHLSLAFLEDDGAGGASCLLNPNSTRTLT